MTDRMRTVNGTVVDRDAAPDREPLLDETHAAASWFEGR